MEPSGFWTRDRRSAGLLWLLMSVTWIWTLDVYLGLGSLWLVTTNTTAAMVSRPTMIGIRL